MRNVDFYVDPEIALRIHKLRGTMRSKTGGMVFFDEKKSYIIHIDAAEVGLTPADLTVLLNKYVFDYPGAPLKRLQISISGGQIIQKGLLHKVVDLPFTIHAIPSITPEGLIRIHPVKTEILGLHVDALMKGLGLSLEKIIDLSKANGASVKGNDILLDPAKFLPPPEIEGHPSSIRVDPDALVQFFGSAETTQPAPLIPPDTAAPNYMFYKGGTLRFGKLVMLDAEMQIVDLDTADTFRFNLDRYLAQLVEGYSRTLPDQGLEVFMRDIDKLGKGRIQITSIH